MLLKQKFLFLFLFFATTSSFGQEKMIITFNDGTQKTGEYIIRKPAFAESSSRMMVVTKDKRERYELDQFSSVEVHKDDKIFFYKVIDVKVNFNDQKTKKKLGLLAYSGEKVSVYYVAETVHTGGTVGMHMVSGSYETYIKRKKDEIAYNMGYIYGAAARGIKKRARDYFTDCPDLIQQLEDDIIKKEDIKAIAEFYEKNCG